MHCPLLGNHPRPVPQGRRRATDSFWSPRGRPAAAAYQRGEDGVHRAFGLGVLTATSAGIARIVVFAEPDLVARVSLPRVHPRGASSASDSPGADLVVVDD